MKSSNERKDLLKVTKTILAAPEILEERIAPDDPFAIGFDDGCGTSKSGTNR